jgi:MFS family permease
VLGLERLRIDLTPLRESRDLRLLYTSRTVTLLGSAASEVALLLQVKQLTNSPIAVGLLGLAELVSLLVFGLWGGVLADRIDRRRLMGMTEVAMAAAVGLLLVNAVLSRPLVWPLYAIAAALTSLVSLQRPSIDATVPRTVDRDLITATSALLGASTNFALIIGATVGGVLAAEIGAWLVYAIDVLSFAISATCLLLISPAVRRVADRPGEGSALASIGEGLRYVARRQELIGSYVVDLAAMFLASSTALLPFLASSLHARWALGLMYAATSIGAVLAAALGGWASRVRRYGRAIAASAAVWGLAMFALGFSHTLVLALLTLVIAGGADMYSGMFRDSLWNRTIPDHLRGRVAGIELLSYGLGPSGGQLRAGAVASLANVRLAIWAGGAACVAAVGVICVLLPGFTAFIDRSDQEESHAPIDAAAIRP